MEKAVLVAVTDKMSPSAGASLDELEDLLKTAGGTCVGRMVQTREHPSSGTYLGKGKLEELAAMVQGVQADLVVCDDELSPAQMKHMQDALPCAVLDRTVLILDIFASHATTNEGKLQVELAQLRYQATRLTGYGTMMSRTGGGIGTRGPGEKKLEVDKRKIKRRIYQLKKELEKMVRSRDIMRQKREKNQFYVVAIVGYTNAGKSTLLHALTGADIFRADMLFATLDPTTRKFTLKNGETILLTDTVGFINKLPHHLIRAFSSTLEEAKYADLILQVCDASDVEYDRKQQVVYETLKELGVVGKPMITVFNKMDQVPENEIRKDPRADAVVKISAKTGFGLERLTDKIEEISQERYERISTVFPYENAGEIAKIRSLGIVEKEEYREDGIYIEGKVPRKL